MGRVIVYLIYRWPVVAIHFVGHSYAQSWAAAALLHQGPEDTKMVAG